MKSKMKWGLLILWMILSLTGCSSKVTEVSWDLETDSEMETSAAVEVLDLQVEETEEAPGSIFVDICGAVHSPGVYELKEGARVYELIDLAGGLLDTADDTSINRAEVLSDGRKIQIFTKDEIKEQKNIGMPQTQAVEAVDPGNGLVNLNRAEISELVTLPGIGESRAADIIAYRDEHGGFTSIEEIMNVNGIKEGTFRKIKDKITIE